MCYNELERTDYCLNKFKKGAIVVFMTATLASSAVEAKVISNLIGEKELREELLKTVKGELIYSQMNLKDREEAFDSLQEINSQITNEFDAMLSDYTELKENYSANLTALNKAKKELEQKKVDELSLRDYSRKTAVVPSEVKNWNRIIVESTAYTNYENGDELAGRKWGNLTASGKPTQYGYIAVDPSVIPLGTEVYIPALNKVFVAMDTGNAIKGRKIDVYFNTLQECVNWGRKYNLEVYVNYN